VRRSDGAAAEEGGEEEDEGDEEDDEEEKSDGTQISNFGIPVAAWREASVPRPPPRVFEDGGAALVVVDGMRFLPDNVAISNVSSTIFIIFILFILSFF
jgi:hypothetical protein